MEIIISNSSSAPIYEQITSQVKAMIMSGELLEGALLPSIRALAKSLHISVITAQRAYDDLQRDGFLESVKGRGTFVSSQNTEFVLEEGRRQVEKHLEEAVKVGKMHGISLEELEGMLRLLYEEEF